MLAVPNDQTIFVAAFENPFAERRSHVKTCETHMSHVKNQQPCSSSAVSHGCVELQAAHQTHRLVRWSFGGTVFNRLRFVVQHATNPRRPKMPQISVRLAYTGIRSWGAAQLGMAILAIKSSCVFCRNVGFERQQLCHKRSWCKHSVDRNSR